MRLIKGYVGCQQLVVVKRFTGIIYRERVLLVKRPGRVGGVYSFKVFEQIELSFVVDVRLFVYCRVLPLIYRLGES